MTLTASRRLYVLGIILLAALATCSHNFSSRGSPSFLIPLAVAGLAYLFAVREFLSAQAFPRRVVFIGLISAAIWHLLFLRLPTRPDDDIHRYVWDGRVQRLGYNPYTLIPGDPALAALHTPETRTLNHPDLPSPYPPGAELFFHAVAAIHETVFAFKVAFVLCDVGIVFLLLSVLRRSGEGEHWVLAYAWHPLLAIEVAGNGHVDIVGALLLVLSFVALARRWRPLASVAFGLAVAVKFLPIVLLPLYWKRLRLRDAALAIAAVLLLYTPFLRHGQISTGSLGTYVRSFRFNDPVFAVLERVITFQLAAAVAVLIGLLVAVSLTRKSETSFSDTFAWPMAASLFCAPVIYPWYFLWLLPFMRSTSTLPIAVWSVTITATYYVWYLRDLGNQWILPSWVLWLEYGPVAVTAIVCLRRTKRT